ncbi:MAG: hypothetical protein OEM25_04480 [Gammaproteobacteria bacterium]|nr:hypothetical protein [Gammaproteobacteria bacterium]
MRIFRHLAILFLFTAPVAALAALNAGDLPANSQWYFHADFKEMRSTDAGRLLYGWLEDDVFDEVREDAGVDLNKEADSVTAFAVDGNGVVIIIDGNISQQTQDKVLAMGAVAGGFDKLESAGHSYYYFEADKHRRDDDAQRNVDIDTDSFDGAAFVSFAIDNKLLLTSSEKGMQALLAENGKVAGSGAANGTMFVLRADRSFVQAGASAGDLGRTIDWDSNILRNTEHAALLIADKAGKIAIEAQLVTTEKAMADSLASIVRGLISLQMFNAELDPAIAEFLQNTSVRVDDNKLTISVALDPEVVVAAIK